MNHTTMTPAGIAGRTVAALVVTFGLVACSSPAAEDVTEPSPAVEQSTEAPAVEPSTEAPESAAPSGEPKPDEGQIDAALREYAVEEARSYLRVVGLSRQGLIDQLVSGGGFPVDIATWAVDSLGTDWNEQAVRTAEQYLDAEDYTKAELVAQLTSEWAQYTPAQAEYAAGQVGY